MAASPFVDVAVGDLTVRLSNPDKVFFTERGHTKLDLVQYYLSVGEGALRGVHLRPTVLKRFQNRVRRQILRRRLLARNLTRRFRSGNWSTGVGL